MFTSSWILLEGLSVLCFHETEGLLKPANKQTNKQGTNTSYKNPEVEPQESQSFLERQSVVPNTQHPGNKISRSDKMREEELILANVLGIFHLFSVLRAGETGGY